MQDASPCHAVSFHLDDEHVRSANIEQIVQRDWRLVVVSGWIGKAPGRRPRNELQR